MNKLQNDINMLKHNMEQAVLNLRAAAKDIDIARFHFNQLRPNDDECSEEFEDTCLSILDEAESIEDWIFVTLREIGE